MKSRAYKESGEGGGERKSRFRSLPVIAGLLFLGFIGVELFIDYADKKLDKRHKARVVRALSYADTDGDGTLDGTELRKFYTDVRGIDVNQESIHRYVTGGEVKRYLRMHQ